MTRAAVLPCHTTETHDLANALPPAPTTATILSPDLAGLEEVYRILENTELLLGCLTGMSQLIANSGIVDVVELADVATVTTGPGTGLGLGGLCLRHAAEAEDLLRQARAVDLVLERAEEVNRRLCAMRRRLEELERRIDGDVLTTATDDH